MLKCCVLLCRKNLVLMCHVVLWGPTKSFLPSRTSPIIIRGADTALQHQVFSMEQNKALQHQVFSTEQDTALQHQGFSAEQDTDLSISGAIRRHVQEYLNIGDRQLRSESGMRKDRRKRHIFCHSAGHSTHTRVLNTCRRDSEGNVEENEMDQDSYIQTRFNEWGSNQLMTVHISLGQWIQSSKELFCQS
ncbi:hypothetical protein DFH08DRAFT_819752 [Mycena albidolilacea]|uniref:Uncharacterized protein n=1 Tax=Mycena albidolilacea TaxID=1033008 RepID=A0AAD6ZDW1_9AGAR|nr:hypothetical protein DFH08DRAFT_819752 [Mycena albidolilacea]